LKKAHAKVNAYFHTVFTDDVSCNLQVALSSISFEDGFHT